MQAVLPTFRFIGSLTFVLASVFYSGASQATDITIQTPLGDIPITLFDDLTPKTVENFLTYANDGSYDNSFVHRSVAGFVIQGGGYTHVVDTVDAIPTRPAVVNEPKVSNTRGTIAMAKISGQPDSATSQWFINLKDNSAELDISNGGFTVFGEVTGDGMTVVDAIAELKIWNAGGPFTELPLIDYINTVSIGPEHIVYTDISVDSDFIINSGLNDAWFNPATAGQGFFINVFPDIGKVFLAWFTFELERPDSSVPSLLGDAGHRWMTAFGDFSGNIAELDIEMTSGGVFDSEQPQTSQVSDGTISVEFSDCENALVRYDIASVDRQGVVPIQRIALDNVALCEQLGAAAALKADNQQ